MLVTKKNIQKIVKLIVLSSILATLVGCVCGGNFISKLDTDADYFGYALGLQRGMALKQQVQNTLVPKELANGIYDGFEGKSKLSKEEVRETLSKFNKFMRNYFKDKSLKYEGNVKKVSYTLGAQFGKSIHNQYKNILNPKALARGISDGLSGANSLIKEEEIFKYVKMLNEESKKPQTEEEKKKYEEGKKFLEENKTKPDIITLKSGVQYKILREGTGKSPKRTDKVKVHYEGKLLDGTVFDSSYERKKPSTFGVNGVIKGWSETLLKMKVGGKYELFIPSDLAYGSRGTGKIPPHSTLKFIVELLGVEKKQSKK